MPTPIDEPIEEAEKELDTTTGNMEEQDNKQEQADKLKEIMSELGDFLDDQIAKINSIKDADELKTMLEDSMDKGYLAKMAVKATGMGVEIIGALYRLGYVPIELSYHVEKSRIMYDPFSTIKEGVEKYINNLPDEVQGKAREYVNALMNKVEEITGEYKEQDNESQES